MRKHNKTKIAGVLAPPDNLPLATGNQTLRAANDNGGRRRSVVMVNFDNIPVQAAEVAVIDAFMQAWPMGANDNFPVT